MNTIKDFKNDLLNRREVKLVVTAGKNPGLAEAVKMIAEHFKSKEEVIVVKTLKSKFGRDSFLVDAFIYDSAADKTRVEPRKKEKKSADGAAPAEGGKK
jgi:ribosomal protein S24E